MDMLNWAEKEIEIACAREKAASENPDDWDYGVACYESALKAFKSLLGDGHSGYSIGVTKNILVRLIEGKPLTPIEDTPDIWNRVERSGDFTEYQCSRMSALFKKVHKDGTVTYNDVDRVRVTYAANPDIYWHNGLASRMVNELFPITMPYCADVKYTVYAEDFLVDPKNGDYDTVGYLYAEGTDGSTTPINRYFKDTGVGSSLEEINFEEYCERKKAAHDLDNVKGE